jgi:hypothetical protein
MAMVIRLITQTFVWFGAMGILLFIAAGPISSSWVTLSFTLGIDLARKDPGLLQERKGSPVRAGLVGYDEYAAHVRYRLIPHVW